LQKRAQAETDPAKRKIIERELGQLAMRKVDAGAAPTAPEKPAGELQAIIDRYEGTGESTANDVVDELRGYVQENPNPRLENLIGQYDDAMRESRRLGHRMDVGGEAFEAILREAKRSPAQPTPAAVPSEPSPPVTVQPATPANKGEAIAAPSAESAKGERKPWEMTPDEYAAQKEREAIAGGVDKSEIDDMQRKSWRRDWERAIFETPRDAVIPPDVLAWLHPDGRESILHSHPNTASAWMERHYPVSAPTGPTYDYTTTLAEFRRGANAMMTRRPTPQENIANKKRHRDIVQDKLRKGERVSPSVLRDYASEPWAKAALEKMGERGTITPVTDTGAGRTTPPEPKPQATGGKEDDYRMAHRPRDDGPPAHDLLANDVAPRDIYEHPEYYVGDPDSKAAKESIAALRRLRDKPDAVVTVYRAGPKAELNPGDWVSFSKTYAKGEGMGETPDADMPVHAFKVKASDVLWAGDSIEEFGYYPKEKKSFEQSAPASSGGEQPAPAAEGGKTKEPRTNAESTPTAAVPGTPAVAVPGVVVRPGESGGMAPVQRGAVEGDALAAANFKVQRARTDFDVALKAQAEAMTTGEGRAVAKRRVAQARKRMDDAVAARDKLTMPPDFSTAPRTQLVAELRKRGLPASGSTKMLRERLSGIGPMPERPTADQINRPVTNAAGQELMPRTAKPAETPVADSASVADMKRADLIAEAKRRGLKPTGTTADLRTRVLLDIGGKTTPEAIDAETQKPTAEAKEPWQTPRGVWVSGRIAEIAGTGNMESTAELERQHRFNVESAVKAGKPVPPEVLADYADQPWAKKGESGLKANEPSPQQLPQQLAFTLKYHGGRRLNDMFRKLRTNQPVSGSEVVNALGSPLEGKPGLADNVAMTDTLLRDLADAGIIKKGTAYGDTSMRAFAGLEGRASKKMGMYPREFWYTRGPNFEKYADAVDAFLNEKPAPESASPSAPGQQGERGTEKAGTIDPGTTKELSGGDEAGAFEPVKAIQTVAKGAAAVGRAGVDVGNFFMGEQIHPLRRNLVGRGMIAGLDIAESRARSLTGSLENEMAEAYKGLTRADRKWLNQIDERGYSNFERMQERGELTAPNERIARWQDFYARMMSVTGQAAEDVGVQRRNREGNVEPFRRAQSPRIIRMPTGDAIEAMQRESGPTYDAIVEMVRRENPELGGEREVRQALAEWMGPESVRKSGSIEDVRKIKNFAGHVKLADGTWVAVLEPDPLVNARRSMRYMARRTYFVEQFGQDLLETVPNNQLWRLAKIITPTTENVQFRGPHKLGERAASREELIERLAYAGYGEADALRKLDTAELTSMARGSGVEAGLSGQETRPTLHDEPGGIFARTKGLAPFDKESLVNSLVEADVDTRANLYRLDMPTLQQKAKAAGLDAAVTRAELVASIATADRTTLTERQWADLREYARKVGGVKPDLPNGELLDAVIRRARRPEVPKLDRMRKRFVQSGGNVRDFDDVISLYFDRPYGTFFDPRNPARRAARLADAVVGVVQTSLSTAVNIPQTLMQVLRYAGWARYAKAVYNSLRHPQQTAAQMAATGAMHRSIMDWTFHRGQLPEDISRFAREIGSRATGLQWVAEFNNMVAGDAFRQLGQHWQRHGLQEGDVAVAKQLRMTPPEIAAARRGEVSQETLNKIVQNGVSITQFVTEAKYRQAKVQNIPILNSILSYNNYFIGTFKATGRLFTDFGHAIASRSGLAYAGSSRRLVNFLIGTLGAGLASVIIRRALKGQPLKREDEDWVDLGKKAMIEAGLLGPPMRTLDAMEYSGNSAEKFALSFAPKVNGLVKFFGAVFGLGQYGKLPVAERTALAGMQQAPAIKAMYRWAEKLAYPELEKYQEARAVTAHYIKDTLKRESRGGDYQINPDYWPVRQSLRRGDFAAARQAALKFIAWGTDGDSDRAKRLRQSLSADRPANLSAEKYEALLETLPTEKRALLERVQQQYIDWMYDLTVEPD